MAVYNIHAGHCPDGIGASGAVGLLKESTEARKVRDVVITKLREQGHTVYDCTCEENTTQSGCLNRIVAKCNAHSVNLDVSIHLNAGKGDYKGDGKTGGVEVICYDSGTVGYANRICQKISASLGIANRGVKYNKNLMVLNSTKSPAILIECCFVDDKDDYDRWNSTKCGVAIVEGILNKSIASTATTVKKEEVKPAQAKTNAVNSEGLYYQAHVQNLGWCDTVHDGQMAGTVGFSLRLEALKINIDRLKEKYPDAKLEAKAHIQDKGWISYPDVSKDTLIGTVGESKRLEAVEFKMSGLPDGKMLGYQVHAEGTGWTGWIDGGFSTGSVGMAKRLEAIQMVIV